MINRIVVATFSPAADRMNQMLLELSNGKIESNNIILSPEMLAEFDADMLTLGITSEVYTH